MEDSIKSAFLGMIYGDAAGYTVDGMGKAHIRSTFGAVHDFVEPMDGLKGHYERWKKPGLYSAISQISFCAAAATKGRVLSIEPLRRIIAEADVPGDGIESVLRNSGRIILNFSDSCRKNGIPVLPVITSAHCIPVASAAALSVFQERMPGHSEIILYASKLGGDLDSSCAAALFSRVLYMAALGAVPDELSLFFSAQAGEAAVWADTSAPELFSLGFNSDRVALVFRDFEKLFLRISSLADIEKAQKCIVDMVNLRVKTPVTRCTVDHPFALMPFSVLLAEQNCHRSDSLLFECAQQGGASSVLACMSGMLAGVLQFKGLIPDILSSELINRRQIDAFTDKLSSGRAEPSDAAEFLKAEIALTAKELQERDARLKHRKVSSASVKKEKGRPDDRALTRHVVESWTKLDKARWKKEQQHIKDEDDET